MNEKRATSFVQPGSVFMTVNAYYQPMCLTDDNNGKYDFAHFLKDTVKFYCADRKYLPDYWLFRCDLPDKNMIPDLATFENEGYPQLIGEMMGKQDLGPTEVLRLRDAAFCLEHGIDPLSEVGRHHNLIHNPEYIAQASRYGTGLHVICAGEAVFPTWTAIESAEGILLFTDRDNAMAWLQYQADHFFDKDYATDSLRIWDVAVLDPSTLHRINSCKLPEELASTPFVKKIDAVGTPTTLKNGICRAEYDMEPSLQNFTTFLNSDQHDTLYVSIRNRKITSLLYLRDEGRLPANTQDLEWIASNIKRFTGHILEEHYSWDECNEISSILLNKMFPDTRSVPSFKPKQLEQRPAKLPALQKEIDSSFIAKKRYVSALPVNRRRQGPKI